MWSAQPASPKELRLSKSGSNSSTRAGYAAATNTGLRKHRAFFTRWKDSLKWQRLHPYQKFAGMIESHWDGIASYCHPENKVSLGLVEGVNNKIRVLQRRAYGYRDEEYLKLKIVAAFLPPLPRNAVFNPHESA